METLVLLDGGGNIGFGVDAGGAEGVELPMEIAGDVNCGFFFRFNVIVRFFFLCLCGAAMGGAAECETDGTAEGTVGGGAGEAVFATEGIGGGGFVFLAIGPAEAATGIFNF